MRERGNEVSMASEADFCRTYVNGIIRFNDSIFVVKFVRDLFVNLWYISVKNSMQ